MSGGVQQKLPQKTAEEGLSLEGFASASPAFRMTAVYQQLEREANGLEGLRRQSMLRLVAELASHPLAPPLPAKPFPEVPKPPPSGDQGDIGLTEDISHSNNKGRSKFSNKEVLLPQVKSLLDVLWLGCHSLQSPRFVLSPEALSGITLCGKGMTRSWRMSDSSAGNGL
ncbi:hypothetical protein ACRRTK_021016 [Alexandromys fortis]